MVPRHQTDERRLSRRHVPRRERDPCDPVPRIQRRRHGDTARQGIVNCALEHDLRDRRDHRRADAVRDATRRPDGHPHGARRRSHSEPGPVDEREEYASHLAVSDFAVLGSRLVEVVGDAVQPLGADCSPGETKTTRELCLPPRPERLVSHARKRLGAIPPGIPESPVYRLRAGDDDHVPCLVRGSVRDLSAQPELFPLLPARPGAESGARRERDGDQNRSNGDVHRRGLTLIAGRPTHKQ